MANSRFVGYAAKARQITMTFDRGLLIFTSHMSFDPICLIRSKECLPRYRLTEMPALTPDTSNERVRREGDGPQRELNPPGNWFAPPIRAAVEATRLLKALVQRVARRLGER